MKCRKILILTILTLIATFYCVDAFAAAKIMPAIAEKFTSTFKGVKGIIFVIGAFGLVGIAYYAISGKMKWTWLVGLATGLAVLSAAGAFLYYATEGVEGAVGLSAPTKGDIFDFFSSRAVNFALGFRNVAFSMAGFGIIMFTFLAISGKINFKHLGYIFISLFLLSGLGLFITYWAGNSADVRDALTKSLQGFSRPTTFTEGNVGDSFKNSGGGEASNSSFGE